MTVYLVGAGPGDPELITVKGLRLLRHAQVVLFDRLSAIELLDEVPPAAVKVFVGKEPGRPSLSQAEINQLLIHWGRDHEVVRLKGGDPFVFARGSEEVKALLEAGVEVHVVPGISSALAVPAAAGIPVTERYSSTSFTVVTGHEDPTKPEQSVDWETLARTGGTLVILMGVSHLAAITEQLIAGGMDPDTPAASIRWGTRPEQEVVVATVATLAEHGLRSPSVIVIGEVVRAGG